MGFISKYLKFIIAGLILVLIIGVTAFGLGENKPKDSQQNQDKQTSACGAYRNDKTVTISNEVIKAEVPKNSAEFATGLGGRQCILPDQGMLFVFSKPGQYPFWMKDMKFPIDIVWIGSDKRVVGLEVEVQPSTYPDKFVNKDQPAQYVLELQANRSKDLKIDLGTPVSF